MVIKYKVSISQYSSKFEGAKMDLIFHEKQSGSLCAQHCLNALLQGPYYTVFDLAEIAKLLDESERRHMAEAGSNTEEYQEFLKQPSSNYDDSGFFSIQVLVKALEVLSLELIPFTSSDEFCRHAREFPSQQTAFICNFRQHWFTVRKIGFQWFNLNSLLTFPELLSDTYLALFLKQLQVEGYSIFVIRGELPSSDADEVLKLHPVEQTVKPTLLNLPTNSSSSSSFPPNDAHDNDPELKWVMDESKKMFDDDDDALKHALQLSASEMYLKTHQTPPSQPTEPQPRTSTSCPTTTATTVTPTTVTPTTVTPTTVTPTTVTPTTVTPTATSVQSSSSSSSPPIDPDDIRKKRLEFFSKQGASPKDDGGTTTVDK